VDGASTAWTGVSGDGSVTCLLVAVDGLLSGSVVTASASYQLDHVKNDLYRLGQLNSDAFAAQEAGADDIEPAFVESVPSLAETDLPIGSEDGSVIFVSVWYSQTAIARSGSLTALRARIAQAITESNAALSGSKATTRFQLAYQGLGSKVSSTSSTSAALTSFQGATEDLANRGSGDLMVFITDLTDYCGQATTIKSVASNSHCVVAWDCMVGYYSFAHELGHLIGLRHDLQADSSTTPYAYGHGSHFGGYRSIMSYVLGGDTRVNRFSCPSCNYLTYPTGSAGTTDNSRVINERRVAVANFRGS
jgi:hypothetical protein